MASKKLNLNTEVRVCPRCNSTDVVAGINLTYTIGSGTRYSGYVCKNCGYRSVLFPTAPWKDAKKLEVKHIEGKLEKTQIDYSNLKKVVMQIAIIAGIIIMMALLFV